MSIDPGTREVPTSPLPVTGAVETLVERLEHEHAWAEELRQDLVLTEKNIGELVAAVEATCEVMPVEERNHWRIRALRCALKLPGRGRPADTRLTRVVAWLGERRGQTVTSAEVRRAAHACRLKASPQYIHNLLTRWAATGLVTRTAHGQWHVSRNHTRWETPRLSEAAREIRETIHREKAERMAARAGGAGTAPAPERPPEPEIAEIATRIADLRAEAGLPAQTD